MVKVLQDNFGIESGYMTTVHAYTNDQSLLDAAHKDPRRARSAPNNIVPTSTGAARTAGVIYPELEGKVDGMSMRVPVPDGSITDFVAQTSEEASVDEINDAFRQAADGDLSGVLEYSEAPIVSSDIVGNPASCVFDSALTMSNGGTVKVLGWYDNEWGYSNRTVDLVQYMGEQAVEQAFSSCQASAVSPRAASRCAAGLADTDDPAVRGSNADESTSERVTPAEQPVRSPGA